jgi:hypothetical protein
VAHQGAGHEVVALSVQASETVANLTKWPPSQEYLKLMTDLQTDIA